MHVCASCEWVLCSSQGRDYQHQSGYHTGQWVPLEYSHHSRQCGYLLCGVEHVWHKLNMLHMKATLLVSVCSPPHIVTTHMCTKTGGWNTQHHCIAKQSLDIVTMKKCRTQWWLNFRKVLGLLHSETHTHILYSTCNTHYTVHVTHTTVLWDMIMYTVH